MLIALKETSSGGYQKRFKTWQGIQNRYTSFTENKMHYNFKVHCVCQSSLSRSLCLHALAWTAQCFIFPYFSSLCARSCLETENGVQECRLVLWCYLSSESMEEGSDASILVCTAYILLRKQSYNPTGITMARRTEFSSVSVSVRAWMLCSREKKSKMANILASYANSLQLS